MLTSTAPADAASVETPRAFGLLTTGFAVVLSCFIDSRSLSCCSSQAPMTAKRVCHAVTDSFDSSTCGSCTDIV